MTRYFILDGEFMMLREELSIFREALCFAEEKMNEKLQSDVRLYESIRGWAVSWGDGPRLMKEFPISSTTKDTP